MSELPRGTVTFLFTDIEGSTRLLRQLGRDDYDELLVAHREIVEAAVAAHEGRVVETQGDSFFVAFGTAADGVAAAIDVQRDLAAHPWPEGAEFKVRMGLHTGEPKVGAARYVGVGVHKAARIGAAGHGGQVLLSSTTKELVEEELPVGVSIRDLGERRLKDFERPERIFQLLIEGLESEFAQLKTLDVELRRRRRRMYAGSALIGVLAAAVAIPVFALGEGSPGGIVAQGNSVAMIDPSTNRVEADIPAGARPDAIAFGAGSVWVSNLDDQTVSQIDPGNPPHLLHSKPLPEAPTGIAATGNAVWTVASNPGESSVTVRKIDPQFGSVARITSLGNVELGGPGSVAAGRDGVWVAPSAGLLTRLDPRTGRRSKAIDPRSGASALAVGDGAEWIAEVDGNTVTRVDPTGVLTPIPVSNGPGALAVDGSGVWVVESLGDAVARIDPSTYAPTTTVPVGQAPTGVAVGAGSVWVANSRDGTVTRIDEKTAKAIETIDVGGSPQSLTFGDGRIWVTVDDAPLAEAAGAGETARFTEAGKPDFLDPALAYSGDSWQILNATCVKLLRYPDRPAAAGAQLEPEAATSLPTPTDGGRTYTFRIRRGFRFSPPSGEQVTAQTFKFSIERALNPKMKGGPGPLLSDVLGAKAYIAGKTAHISGVVARRDTLTIHLVRPAPDLLSRIALPSFCAVPRNTPIDPNGVRTIPAAGPYYVSAYTPGQAAVLLRNPNYSGGRPHHFKRMVIEFEVNSATADSEIAAGKVDYALDGVDPSDRARLQARFGPGSAAGHQGRQQFFTSLSDAVDLLLLNTTRGLFRSVRLRRAASLAVDRAALAAVGQWFFGGVEHVADGYLPPGMPGYTGRRLFPPHGDLGAAKRLAGGTRRTAVMYTCNSSECARIGQIVKTDLARIGITVHVRAFETNKMLKREHRPSATFDIGLSNWVGDYLDPSDFLNLALATPRAIGPGYRDPAFQPRLAAAARLSGPRRYLTYGRLARALARDSAPWIAYATPTFDSFFSARIGCQIDQPLTRIDLAALCIRKR